MLHTGAVRPSALLLTSLLVVTLTGCGGADETEATQTDTPTPGTTPTLPVVVGTVQGRLISTDAEGEPATVPGTVTMVGPAGSTLNAEVTEDGRFAIQLPPGEYTITGTSPAYDGPCRTDPPTTVLVADETVETDVRCTED